MDESYKKSWRDRAFDFLNNRVGGSRSRSLSPPTPSRERDGAPKRSARDDNFNLGVMGGSAPRRFHGKAPKQPQIPPPRGASRQGDNGLGR